MAEILVSVEESGTWPEPLLDAFIVMIPKEGGDATPIGHRPLSVLSIAYILWATVPLCQIQDWLSDHILCSWYFFLCQDSVSFHPRVLIVKTVALCVSNVVALHGSRRLKRVSASSAHKPYKQRSWCRLASFEATGYHVQHKVCLHVEVEVARH